jgi:hypothetical protein
VYGYLAVKIHNLVQVLVYGQKSAHLSIVLAVPGSRFFLVTLTAMRDHRAGGENPACSWLGEYFFLDGCTWQDHSHTLLFNACSSRVRVACHSWNPFAGVQNKPEYSNASGHLLLSDAPLPHALGRSIRLHAAALLDRDRASPGRKNRWRPGVAFSGGLSNTTYPGTGNPSEP